jgi:hypothetical protein
MDGGGGGRVGEGSGLAFRPADLGAQMRCASCKGARRGYADAHRGRMADSREGRK